MTKQKPKDKILRLRAEELMASRTARTSGQLSEHQALRLIHELEVHQIELELQNDELIQARASERSISEKYVNLFDFAPSGYFNLSEEGNILELNLSGAKIIGKDRESLKNRRFSLFISEASNENFNQFLTRVFSSDNKEHCEIRIVQDNEESGFFDITGIANEGRTQCFLTVENVTDRKRAKILEESREIFSRLFDEAPLSYQSLDCEGNILNVNQAWLETFKYSREEVIGTSFYDLLSPCNADLFRKQFQFFKSYGKIHFEIEIARKNGEKRLFSYFGSIGHTADGLFKQTHCILEDITSQRQAEEIRQFNFHLLRKAGETAKFGGWSIDLSDKKITCSDEVAAIHEVPNGYSPTISEGLNFYKAESQQRIKAILTNCIEKGIAFDEELELVTAKNRTIWVRITGEAVKDQNGNITKIQGSSQNITERKITEEALRENEAMLSGLNATKDKLLSIIGHDLRNPFNAIVGFSNLLVDDLKEKNYGDAERYANVILGSAEKAMNLLSNLLEWSLCQTNKLLFNPQNVNIAGLIDGVIQITQESAKLKSIKLNNNSTASIYAPADNDMVATVMRNLISNAIKFTKSGGTVNINTRHNEEEVVVEVTDDGVGIPKGNLDKLFLINHDIATVGTNNEKGTGLGLILCKEFVDKHGGKIGVESEVGKGSKFYFSLPLKAAPIVE